MPAFPQYMPYAESFYSKLRRTYAKAQFGGHPHTLDPSTGIPQIASGSSVPAITSPNYTNAAAAIAAGYTQAIYYSPTSPLFRVEGGMPVSVGTNKYCFASSTTISPRGNITGGRSGTVFRASIYANASKVLFSTSFGATTRVLVNERYVSLGLNYVGANNVGSVLLDFTSVGRTLEAQDHD